jgi:hypothetical protein
VAHVVTVVGLFADREDAEQAIANTEQLSDHIQSKFGTAV